MYQYQGKTALVTGASTGLGKAFAYELAAKSMHLILVARSTDKLNAIAKDLNAKFPTTKVTIITADLCQPNAVTELINQIEQQNLTVDMLVNNAGLGTFGYFADVEPAHDLEVVQVNIGALVSLTHSVLPQMLKRKAGTIINVASLEGFIPVTHQPVYSASKAFVLSLSQSLHYSYRKQGVQVFALCPGATDTDFFSRMDVAVKIKLPTSEEVVSKGLKAFERGKSLYVPGTSNKFAALLPRLLPMNFVIGLVDRVFGEAMSKDK